MSGITAKEIAAKLNLSPAAVSLALNGKPGVSQSTRELVLATAAQLGYTRPEPAPQQQTICFVRYAGGLVQVAQHTSFASYVLQGVESRATQLGYHTQVRYLNEGDLRQCQALGTFQGVAGVILLGTDLTQDQEEELEALFQALPNTPVVVVDSSAPAHRTDCVVNDCRGGARDAAAYLLQSGHTHLGYIRAKQRIANLDQRWLGVQDALGGSAPAVTIDVDISSEGAYEDFEAWLDTAPTLPDALFAENDVLAAAAIRALKRHGYHIPQDVSVVGFDDIPLCDMLDPPLTTVHCFKEELGVVAAELLDRRISRHEVPHAMDQVGRLTTTVSTRLIRRLSVAP